MMRQLGRRKGPTRREDCPALPVLGAKRRNPATRRICHSERSEESGALYGQRRSFAALRMTTSHLKPEEPIAPLPGSSAAIHPVVLARHRHFLHVRGSVVTGLDDRLELPADPLRHRTALEDLVGKIHAEELLVELGVVQWGAVQIEGQRHGRTAAYGVIRQVKDG